MVVQSLKLGPQIMLWSLQCGSSFLPSGLTLEARGKGRGGGWRWPWGRRGGGFDGEGSLSSPRWGHHHTWALQRDDSPGRWGHPSVIVKEPAHKTKAISHQHVHYAWHSLAILPLQHILFNSLHTVVRAAFPSGLNRLCVIYACIMQDGDWVQILFSIKTACTF